VHIYFAEETFTKLLLGF